ncbi:hypothetical protein TanjilG_24774 [Lupinus angustifolius]|uniref:Uncharacterized protein n=1 Tax=Lupinus angustifolius TaxID=3871 RepID=A0A4P1RKI7_LUPAN|nr:PREDICTED: uncharacterized protein LOC109346443 [Lupinus angustifolius]OIW12841.1 hypothetical protein TanjilG_24774 [Lupinus angustifolius]
MAERSKELLHLEHKATSLSSLESAVLVCNNNNKGQSSTQIKKLPPDANTAPLPPSQLLGKVKDFLGVMSKANKRLELDAKDHPENYDIEELTGNESEVIEMDLMLGVADLHTPEAVAAAEHAISSGQHVVPLAADGSETNSDESSADEMESSDDEQDDGDNGKKPSLPVKRASSGVDDVHEKQKRKHSKKCPGIIELP